MKQIIAILTLMLFAVSSFAQWETSRDAGYDHFDSDMERYITYYTGTASDTIGTGDSTLTKTILINTKDALKYEIYMDIDSTGGTADSSIIYLETKKFVDQTYTKRDSFTWYGTADTAYTFSETSTGIPDRYWRLRQKGYSDSFKAEWQLINYKWWK